MIKELRAKSQKLKAQNQDLPVSSLAISYRLLAIGLLLILALMPLHAFLSVWLGSLTGQQSIIQAWKDILIVLLMIPGGVLLWHKRSILRQPLMIAIIGFVSLSLIISLITQPQFIPFLFGLKTNLLFLLLFILAWLAGRRQFKYRAAKVLIASTGIVIGFGLLQIFLLPNDFLTHFGYGPSTVVPYQLVAGVEDSVRILSTLGGPNQLGAFLILPLCLVLAMFINRPRWWHPLFLIGGVIIEWNTFSRSAWLGLAAAAFITLLLAIPARFRAYTVAGAVAIILAAASILALNFNNPTIQHYVLHGSTANLEDSTDKHADASKAGLAYVTQHPLGTGLGSAGPASFHGDRPFIPESYYLQLAAEVGVIGLLLFITICILLAGKLWKDRTAQLSAAPVLGALIGVSIINLFLHGWADSSTTLTYWAYAGIMVGSKA